MTLSIYYNPNTNQFLIKNVSDDFYIRNVEYIDRYGHLFIQKLYFAGSKLVYTDKKYQKYLHKIRPRYPIRVNISTFLSTYAHFILKISYKILPNNYKPYRRYSNRF